MVILVADHILAVSALAQGGGEVFFNTKAGVWLPIAGLVLLLVAAIKTKLRPAIWMGLVVGGGISNVLDFVVYRAVVDYWHIAGVWFNLADVGIVVGIGWWLIVSQE